MGGRVICSWVSYFFNTCSQSCHVFQLMQIAVVMQKKQLMSLLWDVIQGNFNNLNCADSQLSVPPCPP